MRHMENQEPIDLYDLAELIKACIAKARAGGISENDALTKIEEISNNLPEAIYNEVRKSERRGAKQAHDLIEQKRKKSMKGKEEARNYHINDSREIVALAETYENPKRNPIRCYRSVYMLLAKVISKREGMFAFRGILEDYKLCLPEGEELPHEQQFQVALRFWIKQGLLYHKRPYYQVCSNEDFVVLAKIAWESLMTEAMSKGLVGIYRSKNDRIKI